MNEVPLEFDTHEKIHNTYHEMDSFSDHAVSPGPGSNYL